MNTLSTVVFLNGNLDNFTKSIKGEITPQFSSNTKNEFYILYREFTQSFNNDGTHNKE